MSLKLKQHLANLAQHDPYARILKSQWEMDYTLLVEALTHISKTFTHFSRHDASHAEKILSNIEMFIGDDAISDLTATDTWLLLEAAYWHDIGMIVTHDEFVDLHQHEEFEKYSNYILQDKTHELYEIARALANGDATFFNADDSLPLKIDEYIQFISGFVRSKHASRSSDVINSPEKRGVRSPRTGMIPKRIFGILGTVCKLHTEEFPEILKKLHHIENGLNTEWCHPRFAASLLRMGDLLDLDNGRFSPTLSAISAPAPHSRKAHEDKHESIGHFLITPKIIEVTATNSSYAGYVETAKWFNMIEMEMASLTKHWLEIVPNDWRRIPPRIGELNCSMQDGHEIIQNGAAPKIDIDINAALEIFQGTGLYKEKWQAIRELLQNSVDATLIRLWIDNKDKISINKNEYHPTSVEFSNIAKNYCITISVQELEKSDNKTTWKISITDNGIGISKDDFADMMKVASLKNPTKRKLIEDMPEWLRPSGEFGLGLQSVFAMGANELLFTSKSKLTGETHAYRMSSPIGPNKGFCSIQKKDQNPFQEYGTTLCFTIECPSIPTRVPLNDSLYNAGELFGFSPFSEFDPIVDKEFHLDAIYIIHQALLFARTSIIPICISTPTHSTTIPNNNNKDTLINYYDHEHGILIRNLQFNEEQHIQNIYYRGQIIEKSNFNVEFSSCDVDIYCSNAKKVLHINRNELRNEFIQTLDSIILEILKKSALSDIKKITANEMLAPCSAFLFHHFGTDNDNDEIQDKWQNISISGDMTIRKLLAHEKITIRYANTHRERSKQCDIEHSDKCVTLTFHLGGNVISNFLIKALQTKNPKHYFCLNHDPEYRTSITFTKKHQNPISDEKLRQILLDQLRGKSFIWSGRVRLPAPKEYIDLAADITKGIFLSHPIAMYTGRQFILPFFFNRKQKNVTTQGLNDLCSFLAKNSDTRMSKDALYELYSKYISWIDNEIMNDIDDWKSARK